MQTNTDEYLTKRLHELMDTPLPVKDGFSFNSDEKLFGNSISTLDLKDIRKIVFFLSTDNPSDYIDGCIFVNIQSRCKVKTDISKYSE